MHVPQLPLMYVCYSQCSSNIEHSGCGIHVTCVKQLRIKNRFPECSSVCTHMWDGISKHLNSERMPIQYTQHIHIFNMLQTCHVTYMKHVYHLPVPATCAVPATLILICKQHALCPYYNVHIIVLTCTTHEYKNLYCNRHVWINMHVTCIRLHIGFCSPFLISWSIQTLGMVNFILLA